MKRWEAWFNHAALAAVSITGVVYGIFKYFVSGSDPDSRIGHPLQPVWLKAHILVAPAAVFGIGLLFRHHALAKMRAGGGKRRTTGALMIWLVLPLALTGYLVQVFVETAAVRAAGWSHAALGLWFLLGYVLHPKRKASAEAVGDDVSGEGG